jgi:hypothetical protein
MRDRRPSHSQQQINRYKQATDGLYRNLAKSVFDVLTNHPTLSSSRPQDTRHKTGNSDCSFIAQRGSVAVITGPVYYFKVKILVLFRG